MPPGLSTALAWHLRASRGWATGHLDERARTTRNRRCRAGPRHSACTGVLDLRINLGDDALARRPPPTGLVTVAPSSRTVCVLSSAPSRATTGALVIEPTAQRSVHHRLAGIQRSPAWRARLRRTRPAIGAKHGAAPRSDWSITARSAWPPRIWLFDHPRTRVLQLVDTAAGLADAGGRPSSCPAEPRCGRCRARPAASRAVASRRLRFERDLLVDDAADRLARFDEVALGDRALDERAADSRPRRSPVAGLDGAVDGLRRGDGHGGYALGRRAGAPSARRAEESAATPVRGAARATDGMACRGIAGLLCE